MADLLFFVTALVTVISGFMVVFSRNIVHAAFSLLFTLFGVAVLYGILGADFLAVTQVVVYIGGILVLVLFTVMMTRIPRGQLRKRKGLDRYVPAGIFAIALFALLYKVITETEWVVRAPDEALATTAVIGTQFMTDYIFPFEYVSLILLVAMIGAAIIIRERKLQPEDLESQEGVAVDAETGAEVTSTTLDEDSANTGPTPGTEASAEARAEEEQS